MYCWPSVWHYIHRYLVLILILILMDQWLFSFQGEGVQRILGWSHGFQGERKGIGPQQIGGGGGGLDKIECQPTANERVS